MMMATTLPIMNYTNNQFFSAYIYNNEVIIYKTNYNK